MDKKALLLIAAAAGAYALLRPKTGTLVASNNPYQGGAASYAPTSSTPATGQQPGWASTAGNVVGAAGTAVGIVKQGVSIWGDLKDIFHIGSGAAPVMADVTADQSGSIWAGPKLEIS